MGSGSLPGHPSMGGQGTTGPRPSGSSKRLNLVSLRLHSRDEARVVFRAMRDASLQSHGKSGLCDGLAPKTLRRSA
jgi:hypothetical protein